MDSMNNLGATLWSLNRFSEAEKIQRECLELRKKILPENDP